MERQDEYEGYYRCFDPKAKLRELCHPPPSYAELSIQGLPPTAERENVILSPLPMVRGRDFNNDLKISVPVPTYEEHLNTLQLI